MTKLNEKKRELGNKMTDFLKTATPNKYAQLIEMLQQDKDHNFSELALVLKKVAFLEMLGVLNAGRYTYRCNNSKRYYTELYINDERNRVSLIVSKKDSQDLDAMYVRLYDQHKDELLRMIKAQNTATLEMEVVGR